MTWGVLKAGAQVRLRDGGALVDVQRQATAVEVFGRTPAGDFQILYGGSLCVVRRDDLVDDEAQATAQVIMDEFEDD